MYDVDIYCGNTIFNHQEYYKDYAFNLTDAIKQSIKNTTLKKKIKMIYKKLKKYPC